MTETDSASENKMPEPQILTLNDGASIAYHQFKGKGPGVVFLTGFMSDMEGGKALALEEACKARGQSFLRFDYTGHGESSGKFEDGAIGRWSQDAIETIDALCDEPQILVGSSMGGWCMLLAALALPKKVAGLVGIAAAPDFTEDLLEKDMSPEQKATLKKDGVVYVYSEYGPDPTPYTQKLIDDGKNHLLLRSPIPLTCPVRLLHGMQDPDVPWQTSLRIAQMVQADDVVMHFIKDGDHRLSRDQDIERLINTVTDLSVQIEEGKFQE